MQFEQIKELLNAGFTPDQITMLSTSDNPTTSDDDIAAKDVPDSPLTGTSDAAEPDKEQEKPKEPVREDNNEVLTAIADLKKAVQANNIKTMSVDTVNSESELEKAMAEFIRPTFQKGGV